MVLPERWPCHRFGSRRAGKVVWDHGSCDLPLPRPGKDMKLLALVAVALEC